MQKYSFLSVFLNFNSKIEEMILITGATGLVGGNLIWHLLQQNESVEAIRRPSGNLNALNTIFSFYTSTPEFYLSRINWRIADVLDEKSIDAAMQGISTVYHCAAVVSLGNDSHKLVETNVLGTRNVVQSALRNNIQKFCFVSSIAACGKTFNGSLIDENSCWTDSPTLSVYSRSKYDSELEVWKGMEEGLNAVIVNPGVILGVSGTDSGSSQLFHQVQKGLLFYVNGGSGYVDVQDVVKVMMLLTQSEISGQRFIVVGENCSNKDILNWMSDGFGTHRPFICIGEKLFLLIACLSEFIGKVFHFHPLIDQGTARSATSGSFYSSRKIIQAFNFQFTPIEKSIKSICQFMKKD